MNTENPPGRASLANVEDHPRLRRRLPAVVCVAGGTLALAVVVQSILQTSAVASTFISRQLWERTVALFGGRIEPVTSTEFTAEIDLTAVLPPVAIAALISWIGGSVWIRHRRGIPFVQALALWGTCGWSWWLAVGLWELATTLAALSHYDATSSFLLGTASLWVACVLAGWLATFCTLSIRPTASTGAQKPLPDDRRVPGSVWLAVLAYSIVFVVLNWQLYWGLMIPHGDSAMYEEHLWNVAHGKGFRSYLDQGLFLGEHIQVIHLLLLPVYLFWPSHLLLELSESLALAACALPVYWIARRHTDCRQAAVLLAIATLLYFPLQFLDIAVDLKTFRPITFGVPLLLFAIDQLERGRYGSMLILLVLTLAAKEDYALVIGPLGIWILAIERPWRSRRAECGRRQDPGVVERPATGRPESEIPEESREPNSPAGAAATAALSDDATSAARPVAAARRIRWLGLGLALFAVVYLLLATRVVIPWFRGGQEVHYARYFSRFGDSLTEIAANMAVSLFSGELVTPSMIVYALYLLLPLGFLPLLSPGRLAVGLPLFVLLCLNEIAQDPRHHFHAPIVPVVLWAAAAGLGSVFRYCRTRPFGSAEDTASDSGSNPSTTNRGWRSCCRQPAWLPAWLAHFAWTSGLASGLWIGLHPLGVSFWDPGSFHYWRNLYVPGERARQFPEVYALIETGARVASTDFVHPRFTHHQRSYDYSEYPRAVSRNTTRVPDDTDYIVIDTRHYYSRIKRPDQVRELREEPGRWELLPDTTDGYFIVLKRKDSPAGRGDPAQ